jgi:hypothetical protein
LDFWRGESYILRAQRGEEIATTNMKTADGQRMYEARKWGDPGLEYFSDTKLEYFATDARCLDRDECQRLLESRRVSRERIAQAKATDEERERIRWEKIRADLQNRPFDPRNEVSADAKHIASRIVTHLWILFVLLPFLLGILIAIAK